MELPLVGVASSWSWTSRGALVISALLHALLHALDPDVVHHPDPDVVTDLDPDVVADLDPVAVPVLVPGVRVAIAQRQHLSGSHVPSQGIPIYLQLLPL